MKKYICIMFVFFALTACEEREPEPVIIPEWLKTRLTELESSGDCHLCTVQRWTYNDEFFYNFYCSHWSCIDCEIYRYDGRLIDWETTLIDRIDFAQNKTRPMIIWECGDDL